MYFKFLHLHLLSQLEKATLVTREKDGSAYLFLLLISFNRLDVLQLKPMPFALSHEINLLFIKLCRFKVNCSHVIKTGHFFSPHFLCPGCCFILLSLLALWIIQQVSECWSRRRKLDEAMCLLYGRTQEEDRGLIYIKSMMNGRICRLTQGGQTAEKMSRTPTKIKILFRKKVPLIISNIFLDNAQTESYKTFDKKHLK